MGAAQNFYQAVLRFERAVSASLNVTTTAMTKKRLSTFREKKSAPPREKILGTHMGKGPPPYVGMGPPEWLFRP